MRIVHISDIHLHPEPILGFEPVANFSACLNHVAQFQKDADLVVITGDLAHCGLRESYELLRAMIADAGFEGARAPRLLIGNHDDREVFRAAFPEAADDGHGFVQWSEETDAGIFIYLDTNEPGTHAGRYCDRRSDWLRGELEGARARGKPAFLFMHHNPIAVEVANADTIGIIDEARFQALLGDFRDTIRHIFFGHCHFTLSGQVAGIPFSAPRSTNHVCWPDFSGISERMGYGAFSPSYNVCFFKPEGTIIHTIDFLDEQKVRWAV